MNPSEAFDRAFVATSYLFDRRGDDLTSPLVSPSPAARELSARLSHPERAARATVLGRELALIAKSLDDRRLQ